jgi:hypothetical protein
MEEFGRLARARRRFRLVTTNSFSLDSCIFTSKSNHVCVCGRERGRIDPSLPSTLVIGKFSSTLRFLLNSFMDPSQKDESSSTQPVVFTTQTTYLLPAQKFMIPTTWKRYQLSQLVNKALSLTNPVPFDFLVRGEILRGTLAEWCHEKGVGEVCSMASTDMSLNSYAVSVDDSDSCRRKH